MISKHQESASGIVSGIDNNYFIIHARRGRKDKLNACAMQGHPFLYPTNPASGSKTIGIVGVGTEVSSAFTTSTNLVPKSRG